MEITWGVVTLNTHKYFFNFFLKTTNGKTEKNMTKQKLMFCFLIKVREIKITEGEDQNERKNSIDVCIVNKKINVSKFRDLL